jgi:hypothetical protein
MVIRIRFGRGPAVSRGRGKNRRLAWAAGALLTPAAVMAFALAAWRLSFDLGWAREFAFSEGLLSHWQVWLAAAALIELCAWTLNRYGEKAAQPSENTPERLAPGRRSETHTAGWR